MKILMDEDVPVQLLEPLRRLLPGHQIEHVESLGWKGKKDRFLLPDAAARDFDAILTNDSAQLKNTDESRAIRDSGLHHIRLAQDTRRGIDGLALAMAAVMASLRQVVAELEVVDGQRLVEIRSLRFERRHSTVDPQADPPPYWPRRGRSEPRSRRFRRPR